MSRLAYFYNLYASRLEDMPHFSMSEFEEAYPALVDEFVVWLFSRSSLECEERLRDVLMSMVENMLDDEVLEMVAALLTFTCTPEEFVARFSSGMLKFPYSTTSCCDAISRLVNSYNSNEVVEPQHAVLEENAFSTDDECEEDDDNATLGQIVAAFDARFVRCEEDFHNEEGEHEEVVKMLEMQNEEEVVEVQQVSSEQAAEVSVNLLVHLITSGDIMQQRFAIRLYDEIAEDLELKALLGEVANMAEANKADIVTTLDEGCVEGCCILGLETFDVLRISNNLLAENIHNPYFDCGVEALPVDELEGEQVVEEEEVMDEKAAEEEKIKAEQRAAFEKLEWEMLLNDKDFIN